MSASEGQTGRCPCLYDFTVPGRERLADVWFTQAASSLEVSVRESQERVANLVTVANICQPAFDQMEASIDSAIAEAQAGGTTHDSLLQKTKIASLRAVLGAVTGVAPQLEELQQRSQEQHLTSDELTSDSLEELERFFIELQTVLSGASISSGPAQQSVAGEDLLALVLTLIGEDRADGGEGGESREVESDSGGDEEAGDQN